MHMSATSLHHAAVVRTLAVSFQVLPLSDDNQHAIDIIINVVYFLLHRHHMITSDIGKSKVENYNNIE